MDDLNILVKAKISSTKEEIESQINKINSQIQTAISVKLKIDAKDLTLINDTMDKIKKVTSQVGNQRIKIFNEADLKEQGIKFKKGVMSTIEDVEKYLKGAFNGKKFDLGSIIKDSNGNITKFEASIKSANNQLEKVKFNLVEISKESAKTGKISTNSGYMLSSSQLSKIAIKPEQIFDKTKLEAEGRKFFISSQNIVERVKKEFKSFGDVDVTFLKNAQQQIIGFTANITKADGVIEKLKFDMAKIASGNSIQRGYIFNSENLIDKNAGSNIQKTLDKLQLYENKIAKLKTGFTSPSSNGIKDVENLTSLNTQYNKILATINQVRQSNSNLSNEQRRGIIQSINNLELEITKYKDLQRIMTSTNSKSLNSSDISLYQAEMQNKINRLQIGKEDTIFNKPEIQAELNNFTEDLSKFGTSSGKSVRELNLQFSQLITSVRSATNEITKINGAADSFGTTLVKDFTKMMAWGLVATAIYSPIRAIQNGLQTLKELDSLMVDIAKVTNMSATAMDNLKEKSFETANSFGRTAQDYLKAVAEFSRAGYDGQNAEGLSKISLLAQNVGELTSDQANSFLLATDAAYKYQGSQEKLTEVLDGANQIDNKFATSISKISDGITVAGSIASNAGVGVNELSAAIGTMTSITQKSGDEAGRAFRGILMNIRQIKGETEDGEIIDDEALSKSAKVLDSVGIKIHEMKNGVEELRNPMSVLEDLSKIWPKLSTMQTSPIIEALGGKYRGNQLVALVENFNMYKNMLTEYSNASGSAMAENEVRMGSWESKINNLHNTISNFWNESINTNIIKGIIDALTNLISTFGNLSTILTLVATGFAVFKGTAIINFFKNIITHTNLTSFAFIQTQASLAGLSMAEIGAMSTTESLTFALKGLWASVKSNPLGWLVSAIAIAVGAFDVLGQKSEEEKQKQQEAFDTYKQQQSQISSLIENYKQNAELAKTDDNAKQQLIETEKKLKGIFGETAQSLNLQSGSIDENVKKLEKLDISYQNAFISKQKAFAEDAKNALKTSNQYSAGPLAEEDYKGNIEDAIQYYTKLRDEVNQNLHKATSLTGENSTDTIQEAKEISILLDKLQSEAKGYKDTISSLDQANKLVAQNSISNLNKLSEKQKEVYDNVKDKLTFTNQDQYKKNLQEVMNILSKWDGKNIDDLNDKLHKVDASLPSIKDNADKASDGVDNITTSLTTLQKTLSDSSSNIAEVQSCLDDFDKTGKFNVDTLIKLAEKHNELIPVLDDEKATHQVLIDIINKEKDASTEAYAKMLMSSEEFCTQHKSDVDGLIKDLQSKYGIDLINYKNLAEAKKKVELELLQTIASKWAQFYDAQGQLYTNTMVNGQKSGIDNWGVGSVIADSQGNLHNITGEMKSQMSSYLSAIGQFEIKLNAIALDSASSVTSQLGESSESSSKPTKAEQTDQEQANGNVGIPDKFWAAAKSASAQTGVDPYLIAAIGQHETNFGTLGAGREGYSLGYGYPGPGQGIAKYKDNPGEFTNQTLSAAKQIASYLGSQPITSASLTDFMNNSWKPGDKQWASSVYSAYQTLIKNNLGAAGYSGGTNSTPIEVEKPTYTDPTDAIIAEANAQAKLTATKIEATKASIEQAKSEKDYQTMLSKTDELLGSATAPEKLSKLLKQRDEINKQKDSILANSKFGDITRWFDPVNNASDTYKNELASQSAEVQEQMKSEFEAMQQLRQNWVKNNNAMGNLFITPEEVTNLNKALDSINKAKDDALKNSKFGDISRWFNDSNEASDTFKSEFKSQSAEVQQEMTTEFANMQKLRKEWVENRSIISHVSITAKQLQNLDIARDKINQLKDALLSSASSKYGDISRWFNDENEASIAFVNEKNAADAQTQKDMDALFATLQKLRKAWVENKTAIDDATKSAKEFAKQNLQDIIKSVQEQASAISSAEVNKVETSYKNLDIDTWIKNNVDATKDWSKITEELQKEIAKIGSPTTLEGQKKYNELLQDAANKSKEALKAQQEYQKNIEKAKQDAIFDNADADVQEILDKIDAIDQTQKLGEGGFASEVPEVDMEVIPHINYKSVSEAIAEVPKPNEDEYDFTPPTTFVNFISNTFTNALTTAQENIATLKQNIEALGKITPDNQGQLNTILAQWQKELDTLSTTAQTAKDNLKSAFDAGKISEDEYNHDLQALNNANNSILVSPKLQMSSDYQNELATFKEQYQSIPVTVDTTEAQKTIDALIADAQKKITANIDDAVALQEILSLTADSVKTIHVQVEYDGSSSDSSSDSGAKANAKGTLDFSGGLSIVGEEGKELISEPDGTTYLSGDKAELRTLPKGTIVLPNPQTEKVLKSLGVPGYAKGKGTLPGSDLSALDLTTDLKNITSMSTEIESIKELIAKATSSITATNKVLNNAQKDATKATNTITKTQEDISKYATLNDDGTVTIKEEYANSKSAIRKVNSANKKIADAQGNLTSANTIADSASANITKLEGIVTTSNTQIAALTKTIANVKKETAIDDKIGLYNQVIATEEENIQIAYDSIEKYKNKDGTYQDNDTTRAAMAKIKSYMEQEESAQASIKALIKEKFDAEYEGYDKAQTKSEAQISDLEKTLQYQKLIGASTEAQLATEQQLLEAKQAEKASLTAEQAQLQAEADAEIAKAKAELASINPNYTQEDLDAYLESDQTYQQVTTKLTTVNSKLIDTKTTIAQTAQDIANMKFENIVKPFKDALTYLQTLQKLLDDKDYSGNIDNIKQQMTQEASIIASLKQQIANTLADTSLTATEKATKVTDLTSQLNDAEVAMKGLIDSEEEWQNKQLANTFEKQYEAIEKKLFNGSTEQEAQDALTERIALQEKYASGEEKTLKISQLRYNIQKEINTSSSNAEKEKLTTFLQQLDVLDSQGEVSQASLDRLEKQFSIEKAQAALENAQNQKTIQQMTKKADGTWDFTYVADEDAVLTAQQDLISAKLDYDDWMQDEENTAAQEAIDAKSKYLSKLKNIIDKAQNGEYESTEEFNRAMADLNAKYSMGAIGLTQTEWSTIYSTIQTNLDTITTSYSTYVANLEVLAARAKQAQQNIIDANATANQANNQAKYENSIKIGDQIFDANDSSDANITAMNAALATGAKPQKYVNGQWVDMFPDSSPTGSYADGGETQKTGWHWLDGSTGSPERVLTQEQTVSFNKLVDMLPKLDISNIMNSITSIRDISDIFKPTDFARNISSIVKQTTSSPTTNHITLTANFPDVRDSEEIKSALINFQRLALQNSY